MERKEFCVERVAVNRGLFPREVSVAKLDGQAVGSSEHFAAEPATLSEFLEAITTEIDEARTEQPMAKLDEPATMADCAKFSEMDLRRKLEDPKLYEIVVAAYKLGIYTERMRLEPREPDADRGKRQHDAAKRQRNSKAFGHPDILQFAREEFQSLRATGIPKTPAARRIAEQIYERWDERVSYKTVLRQLAKADSE